MRSALLTHAILIASVASFACGAPQDPPELGQASEALVAQNGLRMNGLRMNGLRMNGLRMNGLRMNGLRMNGLSTTEFQDWFDNADGGDRDLHAEVMSYMVACALSTGRTLSYDTYTWTGQLGLADSWGDDLAPTFSDEQAAWVSACLMAHVNSNGKHVQISLRGDNPALATTSSELKALNNFAGGFFGDVFSDNNFVCGTSALNNGSNLSTSAYQTLLRDQGRQCPVHALGETYACAESFNEPVDCATACGINPDTTHGAFGPTCTVAAGTFPLINVYVGLARTTADVWVASGGGVSKTSRSDAYGGTVFTWASGSSGKMTASFAGLSGAAYALDVYYASTTTTYLQLLVNGTTVKSGSSTLWRFAPAGSWAPLSVDIPASVTPSGISSIALVGPGKGKTAPVIEHIVLRLQ